MFWIPMAIGAGLGYAKTGKLSGAATGAALGAGAGYAAGAMGAAGAGSAASQGIGQSIANGFSSGVTSGATGAVAPAGGLLGGLKTFGQYAAPIGQAAGAGVAVKGLLQDPMDNAPITPPQNNSAQGAAVLAQLAQNPQAQQMMDEQMRRQRRAQMWG